MPNSDAPGYEIFWGGVMRFSGKIWKAEKPVARTKKVPGYIKLGRSGVYPRKRPVIILLIIVGLHHIHISKLNEIVHYLVHHDVLSYNKYYLP